MDLIEIYTPKHKIEIISNAMQSIIIFAIKSTPLRHWIYMLTRSHHFTTRNLTTVTQKFIQRLSFYQGVFVFFMRKLP